jgi:hypothetical protein
VSDERVTELLREEAPPDAAAAEERGWRVVSAAFAERPTQRPVRRRARVVLVAAVLGALVALSFTPAGAAVGDWLSDAIHPGEKHARPALVSLPTRGRLLVVSARGAWVVQRDGSMRRLGNYDEAAWSPGGLFVVATRGRQLVALEPKGAVRWSLTRARRVSRPDWSPDGFRIAYLSGSSLRIVAGDGTGDRLLVRRVALTPPAWRPAAGHLLAYSDRLGRITVVNADTGRRLWRLSPDTRPIRLAWTGDGRRLVVLAPGSLRMLSSRGRLLSRVSLDRRLPDALALDPGGRSAAVALRDRTGRSEVVSFGLRSKSRTRRLFAGDGAFSDLAWSPDGSWLLVAWKDADQWLFVRSTRVRKVEAVSGISRQFAPGGGRAGFPALAGWCC